MATWKCLQGGQPKKGTNWVTPQIVTIVVIYIYLCYLQLFLYLFIFIDKMNFLNAVYQHIAYFLYLFCIYSYLLSILFILIYCKSVHVF